ncbi:heme NO-binding domain-containing protein [Permianibacter fluminis]|uniref:heme NO-binding domain-containing protein n=1 Tax=Permianibacter fluminis TaxID=2738515 RepID=UPI001F47707C|nr:heme NO-binding domain-containing protein [Permianibacter fluminis]
MVFTEFLEMVEQRWSPALADQLLTAVQPASGGSYTAVGNYPHQEMLALVDALARQTQQPVPLLVQAFGEHLFSRFLTLYPAMFADQPDCFSLLASVDAHIHREVHKLYRHAELPSFTVERHEPDRLVLLYRSARDMADLAEGLIRGCIRHYAEPLQLLRENLPSQDGQAGARFELIRQ